MEEINKYLQEMSQDVKIISKEVSDIKVDTAVNTHSLKEHMRRTEASEKRIERLEDSKMKEKVTIASVMGIITCVIEVVRRFL